MFWILWVLLALLAVFLGVILVRALLFRPTSIQHEAPPPCPIDKNAATEALRALVQCRTVSRYNPQEEEDAEFEKLVNLLPKLYPHMTAACPLTRLEGRALLFHWEGRSHEAVTVLMSHYDVVPVDERGWKHPPFDGVLEDGILWGRGTLDTKVTMNAALFAANRLIADGFVPEHDVYFAFSGGEEVNGPGATHIVDYFANEGIDIGLVLDEGGAVVEGAFPGVNIPTAMIGIAEKGMIDLEYKVKTAGGHASAPNPRTAIGHLAAAVTAIESHPPKMHITPPVAKMFDTLGRYSSFLYRMIFANLWCFAPLLGLLGKKQGGDMNALLRTTVAFTRMKGSDANNVLPPEASMISNIRLNPADTMDGTIDYLRHVVGNDTVEIAPINGINPSRISRTDGDGWERLTAAVRATWPDAIVTPYLMVQCSDSRHWGRLSDRVYRFSAMDLTAEERRTIHGHNEHIRTDVIGRAAEFYLRLLASS